MYDFSKKEIKTANCLFLVSKAQNYSKLEFWKNGVYILKRFVETIIGLPNRRNK